MLRIGRLPGRPKAPGGHLAVPAGWALRCAAMASRRALVAASAIQLAAGLTGQVLALRRRRAYDIPFMTGDPAHVGRDALWFGTSYSAPSYMLAAQAWAVARLAAGPHEPARQ